MRGRLSYAHPLLMKYFFLFSFILMSFLVNGQEDYKEKTADSIRIRTFIYADTLQMDLYDILADTTSYKPTVILVHGGGFTTGQRNGGDERRLSTYLAKRGFNVASIDYRLSRKGKSFGCNCVTEIKLDTYIEAVADLSKAINHLTVNAKSFHVDASKILLMGSSAGAETVLNYLFMRYDYRFKHIPYPDASVIGAVSLSGAVVDAGYISKANKTPLLFFHGVNDIYVPYGTGPHHSCAITADGFLILDGPRAIADRLSILGGSFKVYYNENGGHEWSSYGYEYPERIAQFLEDALKGNTNMRDFEKIEIPVKNK
ncbi:alpha/beta hydrolase [Maribacter sp. X9]|uniref:alpha/beta hydrolase n=1 Tax=Maribacter sp. X9 TaxID=3402159 RepID=UPI003AF3F717